MNSVSRSFIAAAMVGVSASLSGVVHAALFDRGGGLLYDDVLKVTWLQDANYAKTSGYDADGKMTWVAANSWAAGLVYHDNVRNVDLTGWRLASNTPVGIDWNYEYVWTGTTDYGFNITSPASEMSYMYYQNLGLNGYFSTIGVSQLDYGIFGNATTNNGDSSIAFGQNNVGLVKNLQAYVY